MSNSLPLVSVPVITYNSSKYVLETLESIKAQTYPNIELIISDDCSTDNTVEICKEWVEKNRSRFTNCIIIESDVNTGVSANGNRAADACTGEWVKGIAGDDILYPDAIETYVAYVINYPNSYFCFAYITPFGDLDKCSFDAYAVYDKNFFKKGRKEQLDFLYSANCIPAPTFFYNKKQMSILKVKNDERIPLLEDWPKWINLLKKGATFSFIDKETIHYRIREDSLSTGEKSSRYKQSIVLFYIYYQFSFEFKNASYKHALFKLIYAHKYIKDKSLFWRALYIIQYFYRKTIKRRTIIEGVSFF